MNRVGRQDGRLAVLLSSQTSKGEVTLTKIAPAHKKTKQWGDIAVINMALERVKKTEPVEIYTETAYVIDNLPRLEQWQQASWKTSKGTDVANAKEWKKLKDLLSGRVFRIHVAEDHKYRAWLKEAIEHPQKEWEGTYDV